MGEKKEKKDKKEKKEKKDKKREREEEPAEDAAAADAEPDFDAPMKKKSAAKSDGKPSPAPGTYPINPTKVYMGNLAWSIDENAIKEAFADCGNVLSINWFEEKDTKKFLGAGVVEFDTQEGANAAIAASGKEVHGRETKIRGWEQRGTEASEKRAARAAQKMEVKPMGPKPPGCYTLFMGNLNCHRRRRHLQLLQGQRGGGDVRGEMAHEQGHGGVPGRRVRGFRHGRGPRQGSRVERARLHGSAHSDGLAGSQASLVKRRRNRLGLTLDRRKKKTRPELSPRYV